MSVEKSARVSKLDALYAAYAANHSKENLDALLADAMKYAKRVLAQGGHARAVDVDEVAQIAAIKLWKCIGDFDGRCKFRAWVHRIIVNAALDQIRSQRRIAQMPEDADAAEVLMHYAGTIGGSDDNIKPPTHCYRGAAGSPEPQYNGNRDDGEVGKRTHIISEPPDRAFVSDRDYGHWTEILEKLLDSTTAPDWLNEDYRVVMWYTLNGWKPKEIAKILEMTPKQVSNQIAAAKRILNKHLSKIEKSNVLVLREGIPPRSRAASQAAD